MPVLGQLHRVTARPVGLSDDAKTRTNTNLLLGATPHVIDTFDGQEIPSGALAGSIATVDAGTGLYTFCDKTTLAWGLFGIDADGEPNEYNAPKDHGKITLVSLGYHEVEVYETRSEAAMGTPNSLLASYVPGVELYSSSFGFLTTEASTSGDVVALVEKAPTTSDPVMIIKLLK